MHKISTISVITVVAVVLAGCGGGGSTSPTTTPTSTTPATTTSSGTTNDPATSFSAVNVSGIGKVVVDANGRTVYVLSNAKTKNLPCTDASGCTAIWPDLPLPAGTSAATAGAGINASLLGTMKLSDGETYPTYNGYLLYDYSSDYSTGEANGDGIQSFGGTWWPIDPSGKVLASGSGYNY